MLQATTISEVISHLNEIVEWSKQRKNRMGYFATLYRKMTIAVQQGIINNTFKDGKRMELLDVIFANRYLQAWEAYINKNRCASAWCAAFDACSKSNLIVLQHLILGINTHINLDLGIAAAETSYGNNIQDLKSDFDKINDVIAFTSQGTQDALSKIWFPLKALQRISNNREDAVLNFSINTARKCSWANAVALSITQGDLKENYIKSMDQTVVTLANRIMNPGIVTSFVLRPVLLMESKNVDSIITILEN